MKVTAEQLKGYKFTESQLAKIEKDIVTAEAKADEIRAFHPCSVLYSIRIDEGEASYEGYFELFLQTEPFEISIRYWEQKKKFLIFANTHGLANMDNYDITRIRQDHEEPKQIGVLNAKKLADWVAYETNIYNLAKAQNDANKIKIDAFLKSIEGEIVTWSFGNTKGEIVKNGIEFSFEIGKTYVTTKLNINYKVSSSLETFRALSDNKYKS